MSRRRILVFAPLLPVPVDRGDKNRLFHLLQLLRSLADVCLVCCQREWEPPVKDFSLLDGIDVRIFNVGKAEVIWEAAKAMLTFRPHVAFYFGMPRLVEFVRQEIQSFKPDVFWGAGIASYPYLRHVKSIKRIVDLVDSPSRYYPMASRAHDMSARARIIGAIQWRIQHYERLLLKASDIVLVNSRMDQQHLRRLHGGSAKPIVLENCIPGALMTEQWHWVSASPKRILFVGTMAYPPNRSAVRRFAEKILPRIRAEEPETEFVVCGPGSLSLSSELGNMPGVRVAGFVDDLVSMYLSASVLVVPVPVAGGTQYKLLEAMALGLPIVASPESAAVGNMTDGKELLVGDSPESFASAVLLMLRDRELAARLSVNGRNFIRAHHIWESKTDLLRSFVG